MAESLRNPASTSGTIEAFVSKEFLGITGEQFGPKLMLPNTSIPWQAEMRSYDRTRESNFSFNLEGIQETARKHVYLPIKQRRDYSS